MDPRVGWNIALASLTLAFVLSMIVAWVYTFTYQGLSYMRGFVQTLAVGGVVSALILLAIGENIARGLGVAGALTIIRFRATIKDTRDLIFVFASLAAGVACGAQAYAAAMVGTAVFALAMIYVSFASFGSRRQFDAVLRVRVAADPAGQEGLAGVLRRQCRSFVLINVRDLGGNSEEHAYHVRFVNSEARGTLVKELGAVQGLSGTTLLMQDTSVEM
ncbi:MAG: DUF4956 domain-containing protein [Pseudomonadota bacterium]